MAATLAESNQAAQNTALATVTVNHGTASAGDLLILTVGADAYRTTGGAGRPESSGYQLVTGGAQETFLGHYVWFKAAAGGETSVQYTLGSAAPSCWHFERWTGLDPTAPHDISNGTFIQASSTSMTTPSITPSAGERLLIAVVGFALNNAFTSVDSWLNSFTEVGEANTTLGSGTRDMIGAASRTVTADGVTSYSSGATATASGTPQARTGIIASFKVAAAGGSSFTRTVDDAAGLTDTRAVAQAAAQSDQAGLTDTTVQALAIARTVTDDTGVQDLGAPQALDVADTVNDSAGLTDAATPVLTPAPGSNFTRTVDDPAGFLDPLAAGSAFARTQTDAGGPTDSLTAAAAYARAQTDGTGPTDAVSQQSASAGVRQVDDSAGLSDSVSYSSTQTPTDQAGLTDSATRVLAAARTVADVAGFTDAVVAQLNANAEHTRTIDDSAGLRSSHRVVCTTHWSSSGITIRPNTGVTSRYALVPD